MYPWPGENYPFAEEDWYQDQGVSEFRLLLVPHAGGWRRGGLMERARAFTRRPDIVLEGTHGGRKRETLSFIGVQGGRVRVEVVKQAEDGKGWIVRAVESAGRRGRAAFSLPHLGVKWTAAFAPWEIRTFRIRGGRAASEPMLEDLMKTSRKGRA
jgi:alpha-mannosidase